MVAFLGPLGEVAFQKPVFEIVEGHRLDRAEPLPPLLVAGQVPGPRVGLGREPEHDLVLVEPAGRRVVLVDHEHQLAVGVGADEHVDRVAVTSCRTRDRAVVVLHLGTPLASVRCGPLAV